MEVVCVVLLTFLGIAAGIVNNVNEVGDLLAEGMYCDLSEGGLGQCMKKDSCSSESPLLPELCSQPFVCCPLPGERSKQKCKHYSSMATSSCGSTDPTRAQPKEFPHLALVGFGNIAKTDWRCVGSLISERFVLTSVKCVDGSLKSGPPRRVRLGDLDLDTDDSPNAQHVSVEQVMKHPEYRNYLYYHNIALLKLVRDVVLNDFVRPICLHTTKEIPASRGLLVGWGGYTNEGNKRVDLKVEAPFLTAEACKKVFGTSVNLPLGMVDDISLCAGGEGRTTCRDDQGVPLQIRRPGSGCTYSLVGVATIGDDECAEGNPSGGFARVSNYVPLIESVVWP